MTTYEINQLIVLVEKHCVEAQSAAEAVVKVFDGVSLLIGIEIADLCHGTASQPRTFRLSCPNCGRQES